jgi:hypothetical protein
MTMVLKSMVVVRFWVQMKVLKALALAICFPKCDNMWQQGFFLQKIKYVSIKVVQLNVQKCITWPKKLKESK